MHNKREKKTCVRAHTGTVDRLFVWKRERGSMCMCVHFSMYVNAVTIHSISFFYLLWGHHHRHSNRMVVVAILSSYSYSSGNQLLVIGAIFFSLVLYPFWFYYLLWIKEKRTPRSGNAQTSMRPPVNRISISNATLCLCAVKVINTHMRDVEGNRFLFDYNTLLSVRWTDGRTKWKKSEREREREKWKIEVEHEHVQIWHEVIIHRALLKMIMCICASAHLLLLFLLLSHWIGTIDMYTSRNNDHHHRNDED
jgi:hypothetical protein